jgi:hypothetical protein
MDSIDRLLRDLQGFERRREVVKALRKEIRKPVPDVRKAIRRRALASLPKRGGLNRWAAKSRITAQVRVTARSMRVGLKAGRNSTGGRSDIRRMDKGRVRAPSWGHRGRGDWHTQRVTAGFVTEPSAERRQWRGAILDAVDSALATIRRG